MWLVVDLAWGGPAALSSTIIYLPGGCLVLVSLSHEMGNWVGVCCWVVVCLLVADPVFILDKISHDSGMTWRI